MQSKIFFVDYFLPTNAFFMQIKITLPDLVNYGKTSLTKSSNLKSTT